MSCFGVLPVLITVAAWLVTESGADYFSTTGTVECSDFKCGSYKVRVTSVSFMGYYVDGYVPRTLALCHSGVSEARAENRRLDEFYNSNCTNPYLSTSFDYRLRQMAAACTNVYSISTATVDYTCLPNVPRPQRPTTAKPTTLGTSTKRSTAHIVGSEVLKSSLSSAKSDGYGDNVFSASTQPRGNQHESNTVPVNPAEGVVGENDNTTAIIASVIGSAAIIIAVTAVLAYIKKRKIQFRCHVTESRGRRTGYSGEQQSHIPLASQSSNGSDGFAFSATNQNAATASFTPPRDLDEGYDEYAYSVFDDRQREIYVNIGAQDAANRTHEDFSNTCRIMDTVTADTNVRLNAATIQGVDQPNCVMTDNSLYTGGVTST